MYNTYTTSDMETSTSAPRKQTAFRLTEGLIEALKVNARRANRSLNNYVESILLDAVCNNPNEETLKAIEEARSGKSSGKLDMSNYDAFIKSLNDIK
jgi:hypothetical protein